MTKQTSAAEVQHQSVEAEIASINDVLEGDKDFQEITKIDLSVAEAEAAHDETERRFANGDMSAKDRAASEAECFQAVDEADDEFDNLRGGRAKIDTYRDLVRRREVLEAA